MSFIEIAKSAGISAASCARLIHQYNHTGSAHAPSNVSRQLSNNSLQYSASAIYDEIKNWEVHISDE